MEHERPEEPLPGALSLPVTASDLAAEPADPADDVNLVRGP